MQGKQILKHHHFHKGGGCCNFLIEQAGMMIYSTKADEIRVFSLSREPISTDVHDTKNSYRDITNQSSG